MRAAVLYGPNDLRLEDVPERLPGPYEVTVSVVHNGLCGSDLKIFEMGLRSIDVPPPDYRPMWAADLPTSMVRRSRRPRSSSISRQPDGG